MSNASRDRFEKSSAQAKNNGLNPRQTKQYQHILKSLRALVEPNQVSELRILGYRKSLKERPHELSGYFNDLESMAYQAVQHAEQSHGVYFTPNPIQPSLLGRAENKLQEYPQQTTKDAEVLSRRVLFIDVDAKRPSGISSTDEEHQVALERALEIRDYLNGRGWPAPVSADSGNGAHLIYRVELPVEDGGLIKRVLEALDLKFSDEKAEIDTMVFNPSRLCRLYGTKTCKGDGQATGRPHRYSKLLEMPDELLAVSKELLDELALPEKSRQQSFEPRSHGSRDNQEFNLETWLLAQGVPVEGPRHWRGGLLWHAKEHCFWDERHKGRECHIVQLPGGGISAGCHHQSCPGSLHTGNKWRELREMFEPGAYNREEKSQSTKKASREGEEKKVRLQKEPVSLTAEELLAKELKPIRWVVPDILPEGLFLLCGKPKLGKSWLCLSLSSAIAMGGYAFGKIKVEAGDVLYLALEDNERRLKSRLEKQLGEGVGPSLKQLRLVLECPRANEGGLAYIEQWIQENPNTRLVIVDTLAKFKPAGMRGANLYDEDYQKVEGLKQLSDRYGLAILVVHHQRKASAEDIQDSISGTTGLAGGVDGSWILQRKRGNASAFLHLEGRELETQELALDWDDLTAQWILKGDAEEFRRSKSQTEILNVLKNANAPLGPKEIFEMLEDETPELTINAVKKRLLKMVQAGELISAKRGRYSVP